MIQEYPIVIDHIIVVLILNNLQYFTKVLKFEILSQYRSLVSVAFLLLKERCLTIKNCDMTQLEIAKKSTTFRRWLNVIIKSKKYL